MHPDSAINPAPERPPTTQDWARAMDCAALRLELGQLEAARSAAAQAEAYADKLFQRNDLRQSQCFELHGRILEAAGELIPADGRYAAAMAVIRLLCGGEAPALVQLAVKRGRLNLELALFVDARTILEEGLAAAELQPRPMADTLEIFGLLIQIAAAQKDGPAAEGWCAAANIFLPKLAPDEAWESCGYLLSAGIMLIACGVPAAGERLTRRLLELWPRDDDHGASVHIEGLSIMADQYLSEQACARAIEILREAAALADRRSCLTLSQRFALELKTAYAFEFGGDPARAERILASWYAKLKREIGGRTDADSILALTEVKKALVDFCLRNEKTVEAGQHLREACGSLDSGSGELWTLFQNFSEELDPPAFLDRLQLGESFQAAAAGLLSSHVMLLAWTGQNAEAGAAADRLEHLYRAWPPAGTPAKLADITLHRAQIAALLSREEAAGALCEEVLRLNRELQDGGAALREIQALNLKAVLTRRSGDPAAAQAYLERAAAKAAELRGPERNFWKAYVTWMRGCCGRDGGEMEAAEEAFAETARLLEGCGKGSSRYMLWTLAALSAAKAALGKADEHEAIDRRIASIRAELLFLNDTGEPDFDQSFWNME